MATAGDARGTGAQRAFAHPLPPAGEVLLEPGESVHLVRVRRVEAGTEVVLFDGAGVTRRARLVRADPRAAALLVLGDAPDREPACHLTLAASPPETARADQLVEQLAWLGVTRWVPLLCARTPGGRDGLVERRRARWERLAREAAKGNGRSRLLEIGAPTELAGFLEAQPRSARFLLEPDPQAPRLLDLRVPDPGPVCCLVGPEGGFTPAEVQVGLTAGARVASLGSTALRVEQAAAAAAAQILGRT